MIQTQYQQSANGRSTVGNQYAPPPLPPLVDPKTKESVLLPRDFVLPPYTPSYDAREVKRIFEQRFDDAIKAAREHYSEWFTAWSFYQGEQWRTWSKAHNRFLDAFPGPGSPGYDKSRKYRSFNHIAPLVDKTKAKALMNDPSATVSPLTGRVTDIQAAREFRSVTSHLKRRWNSVELSDEMADWALQVAPPCLKIYWDRTLSAFIPILDGQGNILDVVEKKGVGDIRWEIVSPFEWIGDPKAKRFERQAYIFHAQVVPTEYVRARYPLGARVEPDAWMGSESGVECQMAAITGDTSRETSSKPDGVLLKEMWELATPGVYDSGRIVTMGGGIVLDYQEKWPDGDGSKYPFVPYYYKKNNGTIRGRNAVMPLKDAQVLINKSMSRMEEWMDSSDWFIVIPKGAQSGADAFETVGRDRLATKVYCNPGFEPKFEATPNMSPNMAETGAAADSFMRDHIGVHEVSDGKAPAGVDAGVAIQLLQQSDDTQLGPFRRLITSFWCQVYEITAQIAPTRYIEPRLLMMQDTAQASTPPPQGPPSPPMAHPQGLQGLGAPQGSPQGMAGPQGPPPMPPQPQQAPPSAPVDPEDNPHAEVIMFQHLSKGRLVIAPGSDTGDNPTVRTQKILDMAGKGMLTPENLPITINLLELLGIEKSDKVIDDLRETAKKLAADQPNPQAIEAMKMDNAKGMLQIQTDAKMQLMQAQETMQTQRAAEVEAIKAHTAEMLAQTNAANELKLEAVRTAGKRALAVLAGQLKIMQDKLAMITVKASMTIDPIAAASIEREQGWDTPDDATIKKLTQVPIQQANKPAAPGTANPNVNRKTNQQRKRQ